MSNNCPVTRSRSSVLSDNFWKSGYPNLILSGFGRDRNLAVMLDLSSSRPPASYWRGRTGQCWGWEPEVAGKSGESFISQQLVTCWNFLQFLEENEIIDSRISSNVGCQEVRDVEHHSILAKPPEKLQLVILQNYFDLRLHWLHLLPYCPPQRAGTFVAASDYLGSGSVLKNIFWSMSSSLVRSSSNLLLTSRDFLLDMFFFLCWNWQSFRSLAILFFGEETVSYPAKTQ